MTNADIEVARRDQPEWRRWRSHLSERAWGTVREDHSADGDAWTSSPHDHARSRAYRWSEDSLGGICDQQQLLCLAFAFWNGRDPILKERVFGLTGHEGKHGEDCKEYWWYLDSTRRIPRCAGGASIPRRPFPMMSCWRRTLAAIATRPSTSCSTPAPSRSATGTSRSTTRGAPDDRCIRVRVRNAGPETATRHVLPTCGSATAGHGTRRSPGRGSARTPAPWWPRTHSWAA